MIQEPDFLQLHGLKVEIKVSLMDPVFVHEAKSLETYLRMVYIPLTSNKDDLFVWKFLAKFVEKHL